MIQNNSQITPQTNKIKRAIIVGATSGIGKGLAEVLVENNSDRKSFGYSSRYLPVEIKGEFRAGKIVEVKPQDYSDGALVAGSMDGK